MLHWVNEWWTNVLAGLTIVRMIVRPASTIHRLNATGGLGFCSTDRH